jgi:alpha-glucosidase
MEVGRGIRQAVKAENPQAYLVGENFFDATNQLQGDCWDGVMNYSGFALPLRDWLGPLKIYVPGQAQWINAGSPLTTQALVDSWADYRAGIPWVVAAQQFNLVGSHDTPRALALLDGNRNLLRLVVALLFTYPGIPSVYYGDEIGLGDGRGLYSRQCMNWDPSTWDQDLLSFYKALIQLRKTAPALIDGGFQVLLAEEDTLVYQRDTQEQVILVAAQRGARTRPAGAFPISHAAIPNGMQFEELFSKRLATVQDSFFPLPELSPGAQIWISNKQ